MPLGNQLRPSPNWKSVVCHGHRGDKGDVQARFAPYAAARDIGKNETDLRRARIGALNVAAAASWLPTRARHLSSLEVRVKIIGWVRSNQ